LGSDRLAASIGAYSLHPNSNVLVIDAGTCIKYNFTNFKNEYLGGSISPGIEMRFKSLEHFTSKLPLINFDASYRELIGENTKNSILSGVINGSIAEIDGIMFDYKSKFPNIICILTGGDSEFLAKRLKNSIFTHQNLVLKGLNDILNYNLEKK
jgi:type III pantothenate kinase